jgi:hypothetical protein
MAINGYVAGTVYGLDNVTGQWLTLFKANIKVSGLKVATSAADGTYCFPKPGGTVVDAMTCNKLLYKQWKYSNVPYTIPSNGILYIDIYMYPS